MVEIILLCFSSAYEIQTPGNHPKKECNEYLIISKTFNLIAEPFRGDKYKLTVSAENVEAAYVIIDPGKYDLCYKYDRTRVKGKTRAKLTFQRRRPSPYRAVNTFHLGYKNKSVYAVSGTSRCLFSDKYKTHKYSVGRTHSC